MKRGKINFYIQAMLILQQFRFHFVGLFLLTQALAGSLVAQSWNFVKEQDGIKIFTRQEAGKSLKAYKGTAVIHAPAEKVFALIEDVHHTDWWDPSLTQIKVLAYEKNKLAKYYLVYDSPWPVENRDLYVDVTVTIDRVKNVFTVTAISVAGAMPDHEGLVRIRDYRQSWTVSSAGENSANVVLEGYLDPAGNIPDWISNMLVNQSPLNAILGVKQRMEKK
jgi:hypothetical protein